MESRPGYVCLIQIWKGGVGLGVVKPADIKKKKFKGSNAKHKSQHLVPTINSEKNVNIYLVSILKNGKALKCALMSEVMAQEPRKHQIRLNTLAANKMYRYYTVPYLLHPYQY